MSLSLQTFFKTELKEKRIWRSNTELFNQVQQTLERKIAVLETEKFGKECPECLIYYVYGEPEEIERETPRLFK